MEKLTAKNSKQLDICLRFLYAENVKFVVEVKEAENGKIYYEVLAYANEEDIKLLQKKYRILIS